MIRVFQEPKHPYDAVRTTITNEIRAEIEKSVLDAIVKSSQGLGRLCWLNVEVHVEALQLVEPVKEPQPKS